MHDKNWNWHAHALISPNLNELFGENGRFNDFRIKFFNFYIPILICCPFFMCFSIDRTTNGLCIGFDAPIAAATN